MRIFFLSLLMFYFSAPVLHAAIITIDGTFQGDGLYVQNPFDNAEKTFCISGVKVNGQPYKNGDIHSSAFEIPLATFGLSKGEYVNIEIEHNDDCKPRILNSEVLRSKSTFEIVSIKVDEEKIQFTTKNETTEEPFLIERYQNNKWVEMGKVIGKGPGGFNNYKYRVKHFSGENRYRVKQRSLGGQYKYSKTVRYESDKPPISFRPERVADTLYFSDVASFEIFDSFGYLIKKGRGTTVDVSDLEKGVYYLNIDNDTKKFMKK